MIVPGKLALSEVNVNVFEFASVAVDAPFLPPAAAGAEGVDSFPLPITTMCDGTLTLIVEVKRLMPYPATGNHKPEYSK